MEERLRNLRDEHIKDTLGIKTRDSELDKLRTENAALKEWAERAEDFLGSASTDGFQESQQRKRLLADYSKLTGGSNG
jgi:hypothetical protein